MADEVLRQPNGRLIKGTARIPGAGLKKDAPLTVFRRMLRRAPLPGELDRMIESFQIPEDVAADLRQCDNGMEAMVMLALHRAHSGSWDAWREIMDRVAPKPKAVELSGPGGGPVQTAGMQVQVDAGDAARLYQDMLTAGDEDDVEPEVDLLS